MEPESPADDAGFTPGCYLTTVDGEPLRDIIDWRWLAADDVITVGYIDLDGEAGEVELEREPGERWGFEFDGVLFDSVKLCRNACVFCFMRQLPDGVRPSLVLRDDDFRLSFLSGTFVTLTNLKPEDEARIIEQHISPLRVSLHASEPELRRRKRENAAQYPLVTACLAAADRLLDPARAMWEEPRCRRDLEELAGCLALTALRPSGRQGRVRRRFLSAVTPEGLSFCTETAAAVCGRVYVLEDSYGLAPALLQRVLEQALQLGQTCLVCYTPLQPDGAPAHLLVPGAGAAFVASSPDFPYAGERCCTLELDGTLPPAARDTLHFARDTAGTLLRKAAEHVREAKRIHDELEALCSPYVDFAAADALTERTLHELFPA